MQIQITIVDMKLPRTIYKSIHKFFTKGVLANRGREWDWMNDINKNKEDE